MSGKKHHETRSSLETLETDTSMLDPELYRSTISVLIAEIRDKYNGPELKELLINIHRLEEYNLIKLARCNRELERQASFSFKLTQVEDLLEKYNMCFLKVLEDSPDYRLDDLYKRFVHLNHKVAEIDPEHMRIFGGCISQRPLQPSRTHMKVPVKLDEQLQAQKRETARLDRVLANLQQENNVLKLEIEAARMDTQSVINELIDLRSVEDEFRQEANIMRGIIQDLQRQLSAKKEILKQKEELVQNYKNSIEIMKFSLLTPTKQAKSPAKQDSLSTNAKTPTGVIYKKNHSTNTEVGFGAFQSQILEKRELSPQFRSQSGNEMARIGRTPPRPPTACRVVRPKTARHVSQDPNLWHMLLVQCLSLEQILDQ